MFETPKKIEVKCLDQSYIEAFIALREQLPTDKKEFVKPRTIDDLQAHLSAPMPIIGVFQEDTLVAGALLTYPQHAEQTKYLDQYPLNDTTAVLQAVVSTQKGMMQHLVSTAEDLAGMHGFTHLIAKVREDNPCMLKSIEKHGFVNGEVFTDPLGTSLCGVHFAKAIIGAMKPISPQPAPDLPEYQSPTAVPPTVSAPEHIGS